MINVEDRGPEGHVRLVTLNRPKRRNAVDHETLEQLAATIAEADDRAANGARTRVLVLTGAEGHFCSGADLSGVEDAGFVKLLNSVLSALRAAPFPTIAGVEGFALGAGTQLAVACDLRTAADDATFGIPAAKLGLMVDQWTVRRLASMAGQGPARAMLMAAHTYSGAEARAFGLVQRAGGVEVALEWADAIAALAPLTIRGHKLGLNEIEDLPSTSDTYGDAFAQAWGSADLQEGLAGFRERRAPQFKGS